MDKIVCQNCNEEYDLNLKECPNCNYLTKYSLNPETKTRSGALFFLILIPVFVVLLAIYIINYDNNQSNGRNPNEYQLKIIVDSINIRKEKNDNSTVIGEVKKDEIYTILEQDEDWYKIKTNTNITGWIYGGANYIYIFESVESEPISDKTKTTITKETSLEKLTDYLSRNFYKEKEENVYVFEDSNKKYTYDLNKFEYKEYTNNEDNKEEIIYNFKNKKINYSYEISIPTYSYLSIEWDIYNNKVEWEGKNLDDEYVNKIKEEKLEVVVNNFNSILDNEEINLNELTK